MKHVLPLRVRSTFLIVAAVLGIFLAATAGAQPTELFFSEYIEGSSNNKALEIYNGTGSAINLATAGYNIQMYFNATATAGLTINLTGTVAAGDVYVVAQSSADPAILAQADQTNSAGWFNGNDTVVLRKGTTIIDSIGKIADNPPTEWGTGLTSTADNTLRRKAPTCSGDTNPNDTFDPSVEWDGFANNSFGDLGTFASTCGTSNPTGVGAANPSAVQPGGTTVLTVTVTPGSNPTSTGLAVKGDLTSIGGSATQTFYDDGLTGGDVTANDKVFTYTATVSPSTTTGSKTLPTTITDAQLRSGSAPIALSVIFSLAIHEIQGSGSTSPYAGSIVETRGIVTGVKSNGFFLQERPGFEDADPNTSEGVFVFTSSAPPAGAAVGNDVRVTGTVQEFIPAADINSPPATEITGPSVVVFSTGNSLPAAVTLTASDTSPTGSIEQLEKYEGMRVHVDSLTAIAPTQGSVNETNATSASNGVFYGVITGVARPFRELGIETPDPLPPGSPCCVPTFDANPERLRVDSDGLVGSPALEVTTGALVTNLTGPLDYAFRTYTIDPEPGALAAGNISAVPVPAPASNEFTVGSFNMQRFFDTTDDPGTSDAVLTATAFNNRLNKVSLAIRNIMRTPDIIGVVEMENLTTLQAVANKVNADEVAAAQPNPNYQPYLVEGNDIGGIDVGFLVKGAPRVNVIDVTQYGKDETYIDPNSGNPALLNDRPSLILRATVQPPVGSPYPITVIVNHLRSLSAVDDPVDGNRVRTKRRAQAESLANLVQTRQTANPNEHIVLVGDFNAFQFNDGYGDSIGTIKGTPTPCDQVVLCSPDLVNPNLVDLVDTVPANDRYSYSFDGNAQVLDHELITQNLLPRFNALRFGRIDADFPDSLRNDPNRPERISDHDPAVVYFSFPPQVTALSPAVVWVGLKNSDDVGIKFDLKAEVYKGSTLIGSGSLNSVVGGSSGFPNAKLNSIPLTVSTFADVSPGDTLSIKVFERNACTGSGKNSGTARLWYNGQPVDAGPTRDAGSRFDATIGTAPNQNYYLRDGFQLDTTPGSSRQSIDKSAGAKCSAFQEFGTWSLTF